MCRSSAIRRRAVGVAEHDVVAAVAVEIAGAVDVIFEAGDADRRSARRATGPGCRAAIRQFAVVAAEQDVFAPLPSKSPVATTW